jgi:transcriptional regulator with XRE-family HTH domain
MYLMGYKELRAALRAARRQKSLSQARLAARSGSSRVTISRLEAGSARDVRVGTIVRLCEALDLELAALPGGSRHALETRVERERERARRLERRLDHALLAARLLAASGREARELVTRARAAVDRWERERLCSRHYVSRWRRMLAGPVASVAQALVARSEWTDALFQSSPWAFALPAHAR